MGKCYHVIVKVFEDNGKSHFEWVNIDEDMVIKPATLDEIEEMAKKLVNREHVNVIGVMNIPEKEFYTCGCLPIER